MIQNDRDKQIDGDMIWEGWITRTIAEATAARDHIETESVFGIEFSVDFSVRASCNDERRD